MKAVTDIPNSLCVSFEYSLSTGRLSNYIQEINANIYADIFSDDMFCERKLIGKHSLKMILLDQALENGLDTLELFDSDSYVLRIGEMIFDFDFDCIKDDLANELTEYGFDNLNICIMERLNILPEYRGLGIGKLALKDAYHQFSRACGLFVMQPYPLQLELPRVHERDEFEMRMSYDQLDQDRHRAFKSLNKYYKSCGFITTKCCKDLMFLVPQNSNEKLDKIALKYFIDLPSE